MKAYTIIGGVNGVGKSSLSGVLVSTYDDLGVIVNPDLLAVEHGDRFKGGRAAVRMLEDCLAKGIDFSQETTLSGHQPVLLAKKAREKSYRIRLFYVGVNSLDECLSRIENRVKKGGHSIPGDIVEKRYRKRFSDLARILPYCSEVHLFDNENGFCEAAEYKNGKLIPLLDPLPEWVTAFKAYLQTL